MTLHSSQMSCNWKQNARREILKSWIQDMNVRWYNVSSATEPPPTISFTHLRGDVRPQSVAAHLPKGIPGFSAVQKCSTRTLIDHWIQRKHRAIEAIPHCRFLPYSKPCSQIKGIMRKNRSEIVCKAKLLNGQHLEPIYDKREKPPQEEIRIDSSARACNNWSIYSIALPTKLHVECKCFIS
ncbi:hypothetical protein KIN20_016466 [Parelaphostrongylus tenuis]|uniref:Uncharacterized protein n=1 Tax=Parelaphostrongylus tenuis TaxID=148309 RepID=A0AAD5N1Z4_PARTN|nr:hypothetical protein KIN20_016466 [Parelaphostrongylus tenuis]